MALPEGKQVFDTLGGEVKGNPTGADVARLSPCSHKKADTRIFIHAEMLLYVGTHLSR